MLTIYNTLTARKEPFEPLLPNVVRMYVCGVTVYDDCHLGHGRSALVFDMIRNYLRHRGYRVTYVRNFTDIDDKILARAAQEGVPWTAITARYLDAYRRDIARLGVTPADIEPKATEHIADIIGMVEMLLAKGHAYRVDGDVYYEVATYPAYGSLSKRKPEDLLAGARVEVDERKRNPMDFALWKASKPGEPAWDSPWGPGRPGWHIECSAMSVRHLGEHFDIHGGGMDLIFPHHENEMAQARAATGREFARYWIHNGFVEINQQKMSKSLGNFFTLREIFDSSGCRDEVTGEAIRYFLLGAHYRHAVDFSDQSLKEAKAAVDNIYGLFQRLGEATAPDAPADAALEEVLARFGSVFEEAMEDDFNTPTVIAEFQRLRGEVNGLIQKGLSRQASEKAYRAFRTYGRPLNLFQVPVKDWQFKELEFQIGAERTARPRLADAEIERRIEERNEARRRKDFAAADRIRKTLAEHGITIEDRPDGTSRWKR
jgi:cysteinyl-tRNA synthetase